MYTFASIAIESIFHKCFDIFDIKSFLVPESLDTFRLLWNFFVDYFVDDSFVINFLTQLKFIFGAYHQHEIVKFMHDIVLIRYNIYDILQKVNKQINKIIGPGEELDESEKVEKALKALSLYKNKINENGGINVLSGDSDDYIYANFGFYKYPMRYSLSSSQINIKYGIHKSTD